jgi:hypothetical protein
MRDGSGSASSRWSGSSGSDPVDDIVARYLNRLCYGHGGGCDPFTTLAYINPARNAGFAMLLNGIPTTQAPVDVLSRALDHCDASSCATPDCNRNAVPDACEIQAGTSLDCNANGVPDECEVAPASFGFEAQRSSAAGVRVDSLAEGDLDGDGDIDLVGCDSLADEIRLLMNDGQGNFELLGSITAGDVPKSVLVADWNADAKLDMAAVSFGSGDVTVLLSRSDGGPLDRDAMRYVVGDEPTSAVALDLNRDGSLDLAGLNANAPDFWILLNEGDGRFGEVRRIAPAHAPASVAAADLNADGASDLLFLSRTGAAMQTFSSNAEGDPIAGEETPLGGDPAAEAIADMDGDADPDVVVLRLDRNVLSILANDSIGKLTASLDIANGPYVAGRILVADLDRDGSADLIVPASDVLVRRSLGGNRYEFPETFSIGSYATPSLLVGDLDQNSYIDIAAATPLAAGRGVAVRLSHMALTPTGDCNRSGIPDDCDIASGSSNDRDQNGTPDECQPPRFRRGDPNSSGTLDISDGITIFGYLFLGAAEISCLESADAQNDGRIDISDGIAILNFLFSAGAPLAPPGEACGVDPDAVGSATDLGCAAYESC